MAEGYTSDIRVDVLTRILSQISTNKELESLLGAQVDKHFVVAVKDGRMKFNPIYLKGEKKRKFTEEQRKRVIQIVEGIIRENKQPGVDSGTPSMPELM
jgi:hypothetical protein